MSRVFWFIVLVAAIVGGSWLGVHWLMESPEGPEPVDAGPVTPPHIVCVGHVDVEGGVASLQPRQGGLVDFVADEFKPDAEKGKYGPHRVKAGDVLLQIEDTAARVELEKAQADLAAAKEKLEQAKELPAQHAEKLKQQKAMIEALKQGRKQFEQETSARIKILESGPAGDNLRAMMKAALAKFDAQIQVEESKLSELKLTNPGRGIALANVDVRVKQAQVKQVNQTLEQFKVRAPQDGYVLRVNVRKGELAAPAGRQPAVQFLPDVPLIVRAEVLQEWAGKVKDGQEVVIEDDSFQGLTWKGRVRSRSRWIEKTRSPIIEPFFQNDVRTLECIVEITSGDRDRLFIGQRVRAKIKA